MSSQSLALWPLLLQVHKCAGNCRLGTSIDCSSITHILFALSQDGWTCGLGQRGEEDCCDRQTACEKPVSEVAGWSCGQAHDRACSTDKDQGEMSRLLRLVGSFHLSDLSRALCWQKVLLYTRQPELLWC